MRQSVKGALLSGLVWPGLGQLVLGRRRRGALLMTLALLLLAGFVASAVRTALGVARELEASGARLDAGAVSAAARHAVEGGGAALMQGLMVLIVVCWGVATIDAYRIGRARDRGGAGP